MANERTQNHRSKSETMTQNLAETDFRFLLLRYLRRCYSPYIYVNSFTHDDINGGGKIVLGLQVRQPTKKGLSIINLDELCEAKWTFKISVSRDKFAKLASKRMKQ